MSRKKCSRSVGVNSPAGKLKNDKESGGNAQAKGHNLAIRVKEEENTDTTMQPGDPKAFKSGHEGTTAEKSIA